MAASLHDRFIRWALRARPPEPAPIVLGQRRVYVLPTRAGLVYGVSVGAMLLASINYNLGLGYALAFLLGGLGIPAILHAFRNLAHLRISPGKAEPVFAGQTARFHILLADDRGRERRRLRVRLPGQTLEFVDVPANDIGIAELAYPALRRGWLQMPTVTLETDYPLGLVRAWSYAAPDMRCLVYPAPAAHAPAFPFQGDAPEGSGEGGGREDFSGLRKHQPADSPRHVAWKQAARQDDAPLLTKEFAGEGAAQVLWLDWSALPPGAGTEDRIALLARQVLDAHASGRPWGLRLPHRELPPAAGEAQLHDCLKALALHGIE